LKQNVPIDSAVSKTDFKDNLVIDVLSVGDCLVSTPSFTTSLLSLFLVAATPAAYFSNEDGLSLSSEQVLDDVIIPVLDEVTGARDSAKYLLKRLQHEDAILTSLRVIILRVVDSISSASKRMEMQDQISHEEEHFELENNTTTPIVQPSLLAKSLLYEIVSISREAFDPLQFSSLFLGIGRQLEPHHFSHLFPLPSTPHHIPSHSKHTFHPTIDTNDCTGSLKGDLTHKVHSLSTVEDLFTVCVECGSLSVAASALPLYSSQIQSHSKCCELLHHCLTKTGQNNNPDMPFALDTSTEERLFISQLFCYGLKLEDAEESNASFDIVSNVPAEDEETSMNEIVSEVLVENEEASMTDMVSEVPAENSIPDDDLVISGNDSSKSLSDSSDNSSGDDSSGSSATESQEAETDSDYHTDYSSSDQSSDFMSEYSSNSSSTANLDRVSPHGVEENKVSNGRVSRLIKMVAPVIWKKETEKDCLNEDEIHQAASSFILSGFDESDEFEEISYESEENSIDHENEEAYGCFDDSTTGTCVSSKLIIPTQLFVEGSVAGMVGKFLVYVNLSSSVRNFGWRQAADLAQLLLGENQMLISPANSTVQDLLKDDLLSVAMLQHNRKYFQDQSVSHDECHHDPDTYAIVGFLVRQTVECANQIDYREAALLFDLVLIILARYERCDIVKGLRTYLLLIGVVSGHVAGRVDEILGQQKDETSIGKCYTIAASKINPIL